MTRAGLSREQYWEEIYKFAAGLMKTASPREVERKLVEKGLDEQSSARVVADLAIARLNALRKAGRANVLYGALWGLGGILASAASYSAAAPGEAYVICTGGIVYGAKRLLTGLSQLRDSPAWGSIVPQPLPGRQHLAAKPRLTPGVFEADELARVGVDIVDRSSLLLRCRRCGATWFVLQQPDGQLPQGYWRCEAGCNLG
jgi:hypothetical protein